MKLEHVQYRGHSGSNAAPHATSFNSKANLHAIRSVSRGGLGLYPTMYGLNNRMLAHIPDRWASVTSHI
jgi:hypothetical protein